MDQLYLLAKQGDTTTMRACLRSQPQSVFDADPDFGATALHWAAKRGDLEMAQLLLGAGAPVDAVDRSGRTPLQWIASRDESYQRPVMHLLMTHGAAHSVELAIRRGTPEHVLPWLERLGPRAQLESGGSMVALAATDGDPAVLTRLLDAGAPPDGEAFDQCSPLVQAIRARRAHVVDILLAAGASPEHGCTDGTLALDHVVDRMQFFSQLKSVGDQLIAAGARPTPGWAAVTNDEPVLQQALRAGFQVDRAGCDGDAALLIAARHEHPDIVEPLLRAGADPNRGNARGIAPLHLSSAYTYMSSAERKLSVTRALLAGGADPNIQDAQGETPLHKALSSLHSLGVQLETVQLLVDAGANPQIRDRCGQRAFEIPGELFIDVASAGDEGEIASRRDEAIARVCALLGVADG